LSPLVSLATKNLRRDGDTDPIADPQLEVMQRGFVRYIKLGGKYVEESAGLMGGVYENHFLLFLHYFAIAIWSMWLHVRVSDVMLPISLIRCVQVFHRAVRLILPFTLSEL
jgi:squalene monooxygenase